MTANSPKQVPPRKSYKEIYRTLAIAVRDGDKTAAKAWIKDGADINETNDGMPVLSMAAKRGQRGIVQLLLEAGADIESKNSRGETALLWSASRDHADVTGLLLDNGAKIDEQSNDGMSALIIAAIRNSTDALSVLIARGARLELKDNEGRTALDWAIERDSTEAMQLLRTALGDRAVQAVAEAESKNNKKRQLKDMARRHTPRLVP